jgi:pimeloyl-ACP methyl ester carboxylesterase
MRYPIPPAGAKPESVVRETRPFEIGEENYSADFGVVTVPENRSRSGSRLIHIPFLRIRSRAQNPVEPIFGLAGGPGASNVSWDWGLAWTFLAEHDFVVVGYRGVDGSTVLDCPEVSQAMAKDGDPLGEASMITLAAAWKKAAQRLTEQGVDLNGYTMLETIEDNESVRKALGYERINLLGESYGTRVAYLYGLKYPERIHRSAMIAVNPPGHFVWDAQTVDAQLRYYAGLWARDSAMSRNSPDLYATMRTVLEHTPQRWLFLSINPGRLKLATFGLLFQRKTAGMVFDAYVAAEKGDPSGLALMSFAYEFIIPTLSVWGDLASKATSADYDSTRDYYRDMQAGNLPLGSPMSTLLWGPLIDGGWPTQLLPEEFRRPRASAVQTLLLSGSVDFSTPPESATNDLLPYLSNGRQVILSECGHVGDLWYANIENTRHILTTFYRSGALDLSKNTYIPMDFNVSWGFPLIAKVALGGIIFLALVLAAVVLRVVKKLR